MPKSRVDPIATIKPTYTGNVGKSIRILAPSIELEASASAPLCILDERLPPEDGGKTDD
jgi:hypothetical protein